MTTDVECQRCGDPYRRHEDGGGACRVKDRDGRCTCLGFRWVDPEGESAGYQPSGSVYDAARHSGQARIPSGERTFPAG